MCYSDDNYFQVRGNIGIFAVFGEDGGSVSKKSAWSTLFNVEDPRPKAPLYKGKILDVNQALEVARLDIQYLDWRARQDVLTIMMLHEKVSNDFCFFGCLLLLSSCICSTLLWSAL